MSSNEQDRGFDQVYTEIRNILAVSVSLPSISGCGIGFPDLQLLLLRVWLALRCVQLALLFHIDSLSI